MIFCHEDILDLKKAMCLISLVDNNSFKDFYRLLTEVMEKMIYIDKVKFIEYEKVMSGIFSEEICVEIFDKSKLKGLTN